MPIVLKSRTPKSDMQFYRNRIPIDKAALDDEIQRHVPLYLEVSDEYAMAVSRRDQLSKDLKEQQAIVGNTYRDTHDKPTVQEVQMAVDTNQKCKALERRLSAATLEAAQWQNLVSAYTQRSSMLKRLCELYVAGYWMRTSITGGKAALENRAAAMARNRK